MAKCNVCGCEESEPHVKCRDPQLSVTLRATDWIELFESLGHYYKILDVVDPGGEHVTEKVKTLALYEKIEKEIMEKVREGKR